MRRGRGPDGRRRARRTRPRRGGDARPADLDVTSWRPTGAVTRTGVSMRPEADHVARSGATDGTSATRARSRAGEPGQTEQGEADGEDLAINDTKRRGDHDRAEDTRRSAPGLGPVDDWGTPRSPRARRRRRPRHASSSASSPSAPTEARTVVGDPGNRWCGLRDCGVVERGGVADATTWVGGHRLRKRVGHRPRVCASVPHRREERWAVPPLSGALLNRESAGSTRSRRG